MTPLRCWARRASDGALCEDVAGHGAITRDGTPLCSSEVGMWVPSACAPDAGPNGRETAALRILEVGHEIDRLIFRSGQHSVEVVGWLRAIAARLMIDTRAAGADQAALRGDIAQRERVLECEQRSDDPRTKGGLLWLVTDCLVLAADILRPFAEGKR